MKQYTIYFGDFNAYHLEAESMIAAIDNFHKEVGSYEVTKIEKTSGTIDWSQAKPVDNIFPEFKKEKPLVFRPAKLGGVI